MARLGENQGRAKRTQETQTRATPGASTHDPNRRDVVRKTDLVGMDKQSLHDYLNKPRITVNT